MTIGSVTAYQRGPGSRGSSVPRWSNPVTSGIRRGINANSNRAPAPYRPAPPSPGRVNPAAVARVVVAIATVVANREAYEPGTNKNNGRDSAMPSTVIPRQVRSNWTWNTDPNFPGWLAPGIGQAFNTNRQLGGYNSVTLIPMKLTDFTTWTLFLNGPTPYFDQYAWWDRTFTMRQFQRWPLSQVAVDPYGDPVQHWKARNRPEAWTPTSVPNNMVVPDLAVSPNGAHSVPPAKPPKGTRDRKYTVGAAAGWVGTVINSITESLDIWEAVCEAAGWKPNGTNTPYFWQQWEYLIDKQGWRAIEGNALARALVVNALEDYLIGRLGSGAGAAYGRGLGNFGFTRPVGPGTGPAM